MRFLYIYYYLGVQPRSMHVRGFLPTLHSVKGALGVLVYFTVLAHLDSDI